jgi:uroporphyrinogen decarboxylase
MKINMKEWKNSILNSKERVAIPVLTFPVLEITGNTVKEMVTDGDTQYKCVKLISERYPTLAASTLVMDLSLEAEAMGCKIVFSEKEIPTVRNRLIDDFSKVSILKIPNPYNGRTAESLKVAKLTSENITSHPVFAGIIGPYSLAGRLFDINELMVGILMDPDGASLLLSKCCDFLKEFAKALKDSGANGIVIAEPAAGLLSPEECTQFSSYYVKEIVNAVQDDNFMVILHNCGNTVKLVESMLSTGAQGFHFGNAVNMLDILHQIPSDKFVMGNIDPVSVIKNGNSDMIKSKVSALLNATSEYPNFVLSSGCDIPPGTPVENIDTFFEALNEFNIENQ